ncbi:HlyD family type I secretion periplasmic adaptor subunit [Candidatus Halocynthiibacter alkanivorans]|uniref:HlyD family type I secretion periplasmic adaptor subunit n=1 Tax=Candidatus Halocynthiibacter alkanivorans TaxID=2267619 RepID=UPI000DF3BA15|nr:HlyD family type I secretion periplasmic adaptor subunit [Candidatus Halocynthiibacter alkanivorans]
MNADYIPKTNLTGVARLGIFASLCMLLILFALLNLTMISGAVIASGQTAVRGKPKVVQSLDGGVVDQIFVTDGDVVAAGDVLLRFDPTLLRINLDIYQSRLAEIIARQSRLEAEYLNQDEITFPAPTATLNPEALARDIAGQYEIFQARRDVLAGGKEQLQERILQFNNQIAGVEGLIVSKQTQLEFVQSELTNVLALKQRGLALESKVLALQRDEADLLGQLVGHRSELARIRNSIRDSELEILQTERQFREQVVTELREVTAKHEEIVLEIVTAEKQLERIDVLAPVEGVVHEMQVFTVGGVVAPEGVILSVVPLTEGVVLELRVDPKSVDEIFVGQRAKILFPAFNLRVSPDVFGALDSISPTSITDPATGVSYYRITLTVPEEQMALLGDVDLIPGMPIEAFLLTGERSVMNYLTKPLMDQLQRAFRDG